MKHWEGCWRYASHHACAVAEVARMRAELERMTMMLKALADVSKEIRAGVSHDEDDDGGAGGAGGGA